MRVLAGICEYHSSNCANADALLTEFVCKAYMGGTSNGGKVIVSVLLSGAAA